MELAEELAVKKINHRLQLFILNHCKERNIPVEDFISKCGISPMFYYRLTYYTHPRRNKHVVSKPYGALDMRIKTLVKIAQTVDMGIDDFMHVLMYDKKQPNEKDKKD